MNMYYNIVHLALIHNITEKFALLYGGCIIILLSFSHLALLCMYFLINAYTCHFLRGRSGHGSAVFRGQGLFNINFVHLILAS